MDTVAILTSAIIIIVVTALLVATVAAVVKLTRSDSIQAASSGIGLALYAAAVGSALPAVNSGVSAVIGQDTAFLIAELFYLFAAHFLKVAFVPAGRLRGQSGWRQLDTVVVILIAIVVFLLYFQIDPAEMSGMAIQSNEEPHAEAIITLVRLHSMGTAMLVIPRAIGLVEAPWFTRGGRIGAAVVLTGYVTALIVGAFRIVANGPIEPPASVAVLEAIAGPVSLLLIVSGHLIIFLRGRQVSWSLGGVGVDPSTMTPVVVSRRTSSDPPE